MKKIVFYDTETTGLPVWKEPSGGENQPHLVQLSAVQCNADTREVLQRIDLIVYQEDGWGMSPEALETHGISVEKSQQVGVPESIAISLLLNLSAGAVRVAHNRTFDQRIIRIGLKRYDFPENVIDTWADKETHQCTMLAAKPIMKLLPRNKYGYKSPKLEEAYKFFCGRELGDKAHSSIHDTNACMAIYWAMQDYKEPKRVENPCPNCGKEWELENFVCKHCGYDVPF